MCNCGISKLLGAHMVMAISILTIILSISAIQATISGILNPTLYYVNMNIQVGVMGIIAFLALVTGGIFGICGVRKHSFKCVMVLWFCLLFISSWSFGMSVAVQGVYEALVSDNKLTVVNGRFTAANDIERVSELSKTNLCVATASCKCNLSATEYATFITALGAGVDAAAGYKKFQDCIGPSWYNEYSRPAVMMAALESNFHCTGFNSSPPVNIYYFTDVNTVIPISGNTCNAHYDKLILANTAAVSQQFMGMAFGGMFFLIWLCVVGINFQMRPKASQMSSSPGMV